MDSPFQEWGVFIERCLENRVRSEKFDILAQKLHARSPIEGKYLIGLLLRPRSFGCELMDPLVPSYFDRMMSQGYIDAADALSATFRWSKDHRAKDGADDMDVKPEKPEKPQKHNAETVDELIIHRLTRAFVSGERPRNPTEVCRSLKVMTIWMAAQNKNSMLHAMNGATEPEQIQQIITRDALGQLMIALLENTKVVGVLNSQLFRKDERKQLAQALSAFIPYLSPTSMNTAERLGISQKAHNLIEEPVNDLIGDKEANDLAVATLQREAVVDLPAVNSRAALFIFISSLLVGRPLTDDSAILGYLNNRYKGDVQTSAIDLITATFDVLSNSINRHESDVQLLNSRSFLVNKIPVLLTALTTTSFGSFQPLNPEFCITQALGHLDPNTFPSFSQQFEFAGGNSVLSDVRQDFLFACALHQLIPVESIERLLGETPMSGLPPSGRYVKNDLAAQCSSNTERVEELLNEIEGMDGNAGSIVAAVTEVIRNLCNSKETMSLKAICNGLSRRSQAMDIMLQFTSPSSILQPLCHLLDSWRYEEDQGEYQPVYDEFGAILLLVLAFIHRYDLKYQELGLASDSFVPQLLSRGHIPITTAELTDDQSKHLGGWVKGLYGTDGVDNILTSCRPQEFYLLVPTLFSQTVLGCATDVLPLDTVKSGLEYLLETFLAPSLVGALTWMASRAVQRPGRALAVLLQIFNKLLRPASISGDAQAMHGTILSIVSRPLEKCFRILIQQKTPSKEPELLLERIKPHLNYKRTPYASVPDLESWTTAPSTLNLALRTAVHHLTSWSTAAAAAIILNNPPPNYTHTLLSTAVALHGPHRILTALLSTLTSSPPDSAPFVLDILTALIAAPTPSLSAPWLASTTPSPVPSSAPSLRTLLATEYSDLADTFTSDPLAAEAVVRLHRRVEAQLAPVVIVLPVVDAAADATDGDAGMAALAAAQGMMPLPLHGIPDIDAEVEDAVKAAAAAVEGGAEGMDLGGDVLAGLGDLETGEGTGDGTALEGFDMGSYDEVWGGLELGDDDMNF